MQKLNQASRRSPHYEQWIVIFLALLFGTITLNRLAIVYLLPFIIDEFEISYAMAGALTSVLSVTFAFSTWIVAGLSDRVGRKVVMIPATFFFFLMSWCSGVAQSFVQMLLVRALMGVGQGPVLPASIATIGAESKPTRRGFNFGLHAALTPLVAFGIGPIIITQLSKIFSWRMVFFLAGVPVFIIGAILFFYMREPRPNSITEPGHFPVGTQKKHGLIEPLKYRNVVISCIVQFLSMSGLFVFVTFSVVYFTKELHLSLAQAGILVSFAGFGGLPGCILLPMLSDHVGRKPVLICSSVFVGLGFLGILLSGSNFFLLAALVTVSGLAMGGLSPLAVSALTTESVPSNMAATSSAIPVAFGEILGAGLMPFMAGYLSDVYSLKGALVFAGAAPLIAAFVGLFYHETAPLIIGNKPLYSLEGNIE